MSKPFLVIIILISLGLGACNKSEENEEIQGNWKNIPMDQKSAKLIECDNTFGLELFSRLTEIQPDKNVVISPLSVSLALAMTYNGAQGETKTAMEKAMKLNGLNIDEINNSYQNLIKALLEVDPKVTMEIAQSIWYRQGFNVLNSFKTVNQTYYEAEVNELDFSRTDAKKIVNGWIEDKTHNRIKDMIQSISPDVTMFLINTLYFKGIWSTKFNKEKTFESLFYLENGTSSKVSMMTKTDSVNYLSNDTFTSIEMPYGQGNYNMAILLPNQEKNCNDIVSKLTSGNWSKWMKTYRPISKLIINMPSFKYEYTTQLNEPLMAMGMDIAFTPLANFNGICNNSNIYIGYVQHNTFIEVNEDGTEAAAATVVAIYDSVFIGETTPYFTVNKPFIFAITEKSTGAIVFIGKINSI